MKKFILLLLLPISAFSQLNTDRSLLLLTPQDAAFRRSLGTNPNLSGAFHILQAIEQAQMLGENISSLNFNGMEVPDLVVDHINDVLQYTAYTQPGSPGNQLVDSVSWGDITKAPYIGKWIHYPITGGNETYTGQTLQDIPGLSAPLLANSIYEFEAILSVQTTGTAGLGYGIQYSELLGSSVEAIVTGPPTSTVSNNRISNFNQSNQPWCTASNQQGGILIKGSIITGPNAGILTIRHLKVNSGTSTVFAKSFLKVMKIQ